MLFFHFFYIFFRAEILKNPEGFRCNFETNIRLRVPATGKTTRYPPSFELVTSFLVLMVPPCRFFPASHSPCICFISPFIKKKHKINMPGIWERDIFRVSLFACLIRNTKMYRKKMREWKRTQACIEGALALSHQKNPRIFGCAAAKTAGFFHNTQLARRLVYFATVAFFFCGDFVFHCRRWDPLPQHFVFMYTEFVFMETDNL